MNDQLITDQVDQLLAAGLLKNKDEAIAILSEFWKDKITTIWTKEDVHEWASGFDENTPSPLTDDQAIAILHETQDNFDANQGINWEAIALAAENLGIHIDT
jgi:hypothetical protein